MDDWQDVEKQADEELIASCQVLSVPAGKIKVISVESVNRLTGQESIALMARGDRVVIRSYVRTRYQGLLPFLTTQNAPAARGTVTNDVSRYSEAV